GSSSVGPSGPLTFKRRNREARLFDVQTQVDEGSFETMMLPGNYDLLFAPENYPSRVWRNRSLANLDNLSVPVERDLATIQGTVVYRPETPSENAATQKVPSAHVVAVSEDGRFTTTIDTTATGMESGGGEEDRGRFVLRAIPADEPVTYALIINPGPETLLPKVRISEAFTVDENGSDEFLPESTTNLGTYPRTSSRTNSAASLSFRLAVPEGAPRDAIDWSRTRVIARAKSADLAQDGKTPEFRRETTPKSNGTVELTLLPARYDIRVYPPADARLASTKIAIDLTDPTKRPLSTFSDWRFKKKLRGRVLDSTGAPVAGARLEFWPEGLRAEKFRDRLKVTATTDANGRYTVWLEPRRHEITVRPPPDSGLPRHRATVRSQMFDKDKRIKQLQLPEPLLLRGSVRGASGQGANPIAGTAISATIADGDSRRLLGKATTDDQGRFLMIVPASRQ
ncbi:MAG: hypothetical protein ABEN55_08150, partial [Bradymonadaceae bacterium]